MESPSVLVVRDADKVAGVMIYVISHFKFVTEFSNFEHFLSFVRLNYCVRQSLSYNNMLMITLNS